SPITTARGVSEESAINEGQIPNLGVDPTAQARITVMTRNGAIAMTAIETASGVARDSGVKYGQIAGIVNRATQPGFEVGCQRAIGEGKCAEIADAAAVGDGEA